MEEFTKYEQARIVGARALQISMGAPILIKLTEDDLKNINYSTVQIAKMEFEQGLIPISVKRPLPGSIKTPAIPKPFNQTELEELWEELRQSLLRILQEGLLKSILMNLLLNLTPIRSLFVSIQTPLLPK